MKRLKCFADITIGPNHPAAYLAAINKQSPKAKELARAAYATLRATALLKEQYARCFRLHNYFLV